MLRVLRTALAVLSSAVLCVFASLRSTRIRTSASRTESGVPHARKRNTATSRRDRPAIAPAGAPPQMPAPPAVRAAGSSPRSSFCTIAGGWFWWFHGPKFWTDGEALRFPDRRTRCARWRGSRRGRSSEINTPDQEYEPAVSPEGDELYFVRGKATRNADIYVSYRRGGAGPSPPRSRQ